MKKQELTDGFEGFLQTYSLAIDELNLTESQQERVRGLLKRAWRFGRADAIDSMAELKQEDPAKKERNLFTVIDAMLAVIPQCGLRVDLIQFKDSVFMILPEDSARHWRRCGEILAKHLPPKDTEWHEWHRKAYTIWTGPPIFPGVEQ